MLHRIARAHVWIAAALAAIVLTAGLIWNTRVAAGADAYGYVSQVDLWRRGDLHIDQGFGASVPWPMARWTFTPLGYRPAPSGHHIVPQYSAGFPLLMAAFAVIAGRCAMFWVVPICAAILVLATYAIGRRLKRPIVGVAAAWIVATSPTLLFMTMAPMSDVPGAAAWAASVAFALGDSRLSAAGAGVAAAIAILIRPNLAPLAGVILLWLIWRRALARRSMWFLFPAAAGAIAVGMINARLYGSPLMSGYDMTDAYRLSYVIPNVKRYVTWLMTVETPFALAGFVCLAMASSHIWRSRESRDARWLFAGMAAVIWISYLLYVPWDAWWYLRFLLPAWPMMAIATASLAAAAYRGGSLRADTQVRPFMPFRVAAVAVVAAIGVSGVWQAVKRDTFAVARGEAKYVEVARTVEALTQPDDVIISAQHSGSLRYYAGRLTLRWDFSDPAWLDRTVAWLAAHGHHPYFVLEPQEIAELRARFGRASASARLDWTPMVSFRNGAVTMYDGVRRDRSGVTVSQAPSRAIADCPPQKPWPVLREIR